MPRETTRRLQFVSAELGKMGYKVTKINKQKIILTPSSITEVGALIRGIKLQKLDTLTN